MIKASIVMTFNYSSTIKLLPKTFHIDLLNNCITAGLSILCQISCQSGLTTYSWSYWQGISQVNRFWKSSQYYSINMQKLLDEILIARFNYFMGTLLWINLMLPQRLLVKQLDNIFYYSLRKVWQFFSHSSQGLCFHMQLYE